MSYSQHPFIVNPGDDIVFHLCPEDGWQFDENGIVINTAQNGDFAAWPPANQAHPSSNDANTWLANAPADDLTTKYSYTINLVNSITGLKLRWDPELENRP